MKKLLFLLMPIMLTACISQENTLRIEPAPPVEEETKQPEPQPTEVTTIKTEPVKQKIIPTKKTTTSIKPETETDEMTKELDNLLDDLISGI